jgi:hypothetical protein
MSGLAVLQVAQQLAAFYLAENGLKHAEVGVPKRGGRLRPVVYGNLVVVHRSAAEKLLLTYLRIIRSCSGADGRTSVAKVRRLHLCTLARCMVRTAAPAGHQRHGHPATQCQLGTSISDRVRITPQARPGVA